jgi:hypothetical protein
LLFPIAKAMARLVCEEDFQHVKACEGHRCALMFVDRTRGAWEALVLDVSLWQSGQAGRSSRADPARSQMTAFNGLNVRRAV